MIDKMVIDKLNHTIIGCAMKVRNRIINGFLQIKLSTNFIDRNERLISFPNCSKIYVAFQPCTP